jgi:GcrA cell cycle regulator
VNLVRRDSPDAHNPPAVRPPIARTSGGVQYERADGTEVWCSEGGTWSPGTKLHARLVALWDEGVSAAQIGERLGYSKNAIVGAVRRNDLPPRPSPIKRHSALSAKAERLRQWRAARKAAKAATLSRAPRIAPPKRPAPSLPALVDARPPPLRRPPVATGRGCVWPLGDPGTPGFRFCGEPGEPGRPYCADHCGLAYVGFGKWRSDNARALRGDAV